jgi:hypothetical protein
MLDASSTRVTYFPVIPLCPILIWIVLVGFFLAICFATQEGIIRLKRLHQIPCSRCAFFTGNYRLKCTVHPCKALSEDAVDCLDYEPVASTKLVRSPAKTISQKCLKTSCLLTSENS